MTTTVAVISDTHLPRRGRVLPPECERRLRSAELILHAGDLAAPELLEALEALGPPVLAVAGNVDSPELQTRLPATRQVDVGAARIGMVHDAGPAAGRLTRLHGRFPECDVVVFGHSHIPLHDVAVRAGVPFQICNPGSPTDRRRQPHHTMGLLRIAGSEVGWELVRL